MKPATLEKWSDSIVNRQATLLITYLESGEQRLVKEEENWQSDELAPYFQELFVSGKSKVVTLESGEQIFFNVSLPPVKLLIIGAVHISQVLAPMAIQAGLDVAIIDPRTAFATSERFAGINLIAEWPQDATSKITFDPYTAVVAVTHDPKIDDFPIIEALKANCFYVGALGSKKTHLKRVERLQQSGLQDSDIEKIHAPIGLNIGAASPAEIAVAILAEIIKSMRLDKQLDFKNGDRT